ncbi:MAG: class I SAM-dependent DNA methyltransferase [Anaerolineales bacterium]
MSPDSFGTQYASFYDALYSDKDYEAECDLIEEIVRRYGDRETVTILDLGCGTGGHSIPLSQRGYSVTGVDRSEPMLAEARLKAGATNPPELVYGDVRNADLRLKFDVVLMMFAVLGYQTSDEDLRQALSTVARHLKSGGLFIGDVWYGPAVVEIRPSDRSRTVETANGELTRVAAPSLDSVYNLCTVEYQLTLGNETEVWEEQHTMRYFFHEELERYFNEAGIELVEMLPFPDINSKLTSSNWNALFCGRVP